MAKPIRYEVRDNQTGSIVGTFKSGARASAFADRRDLAYGAVRYSRRAIWAD